MKEFLGNNNCLINEPCFYVVFIAVLYGPSWAVLKLFEAICVRNQFWVYFILIKEAIGVWHWPTIPTGSLINPPKMVQFLQNYLCQTNL